MPDTSDKTKPDKSCMDITSREQLLFTLAEAAEIEHNLMCCYLYAAWSLKTEPDDDVPDEVRSELKKWQRAIIEVAIDEMTHLTLVANMMMAMGGVAHIERPNFPISNGYLPAGLKVRLAPFNRDTLQHFIHLERPEGSSEPDGAAFTDYGDYVRGLYGLRLMPTPQDYDTVGELYRHVEKAIVRLSREMGESKLFCGDPALQVGTDIVALKGLVDVKCLKTACQAIETIVEQGEGAATACDRSHFRRFIAIRDSMDALEIKYRGLELAYPAATNPVMRRPAEPDGRVWIQRPDAVAVLDLGNGVYNHMLRFLAQGFASAEDADKRRLINLGIDMMMALSPLAKELTRLKANDIDECNAGLSFATMRSYAPTPAHPSVMAVLTERVGELAEGAGRLHASPRTEAAQAALTRIFKTMHATSPTHHATSEASQMETVTPASTAPKAHQGSNSGPEIIEGTDLTLIVDMKRCIHSRYCVTGAPKTFIANVVGPWLHPDETETARLVEIAHLCPSGAVDYRRKDGHANEPAPNVNMARLRENGPYAINAPLIIAGEDKGYRATLCRCGASKNKPYCDGSHHEVKFAATGEVEMISLDPLEVRNGPLHIDPQRNGPLLVSGNLEICAGTGHVIKRITEAKLCRCGQSGSKPFCDGSHRAAGFEAEGA